MDPFRNAVTSMTQDNPSASVSHRVNEFPPTVGAFIEPDGSGFWCVWAPAARFVDLVLEHEGQNESCASESGATDGRLESRMSLDGRKCRSIPTQRGKWGYYTHREPTVSAGQRYAFRVNDGPARPDPASRWQPDGVHRSSAVWCPHEFDSSFLRFRLRNSAFFPTFGLWTKIATRRLPRSNQR
jgi:1,4-alpha-glucan branching enzyme